MRISPWAAAALLTGATATCAFGADCKIVQVAEIKVAPGTLRPIAEGEIDGHPAKFLLDTGAWASTLTLPTAVRLGLRPTGSSARTFGLGGAVETRMATVSRMRISGLTAGRTLMAVSGDGDSDFDILLGDEYFNDYDVEIDLKGGVFRLLHLNGCSDDEAPYWSKGAYGIAPLMQDALAPSQHYKVQVKLNGRPVEAMVDSGAVSSFVTPAAIRGTGAKLEDSDVRISGLAGRPIRTAVAQFDTFAIDQEAIRNPRLRAADAMSNVGWKETGSRIPRGPSNPVDMVLGADFLRAHHVLLSLKRGKMYFTYVGGPVFVVPVAEREGENPPPPAAVRAPG